MNYELRIIIYMCALGLDNFANSFLSRVQQLAREHQQTFPESPVAFAVFCSKMWSMGESKGFNRTCISFFDTASVPAQNLTDDPNPGKFQNPGEKDVLKNFLIKMNQRKDNAEKNIFILWGHGGVYFTFSGQPDIKLNNFITHVAGQLNKNLLWFKMLKPMIIADAFLENTPLDSQAIAADIVSENFEFVQQKGGRLNLFPILKPKHRFAKRMLNDFKILKGVPESDHAEIEIWQLTMDEIRDVIAEQLPQKLDILIFDNCLMQCIDNRSLLRNTTSYIVGSQDYLYCEDIKSAWEVKAVLSKWNKTPKEMALAIVDEFDPTVRQQNQDLWAYSCILTEDTDTLASLFKDLCETLTSQIALLLPIITNARAACSNFTDDGISQALPLSLIDLEWFLQNLRFQLSVATHEVRDEVSTVLSQRITDTLQALQITANGTVNFSRAGSKRGDGNGAFGSVFYGAKGISLLFPRNNEDLEKIKKNKTYAPLFAELSSSNFLQETGWKKFIEAFCTA